MSDWTLGHVGPDASTEEIAREALLELQRRERRKKGEEKQRGPFKEGGRAERARRFRIEHAQKSLDHLNLLRHIVDGRAEEMTEDE